MAEQYPPPTSISAAAHAYQLAGNPIAAPTSNGVTSPPPATVDTVMDEIASENTTIPAILPPGYSNTSSPAPARIPTPIVNHSPSAASLAPDSLPVIPSQALPNGASVREYFNQNVTTVLMEGMKQLARDQPTNPLRTLGEYILQRSKELEG